jgi:hypothetical protein
LRGEIPSAESVDRIPGGSRFAGCTPPRTTLDRSSVSTVSRPHEHWRYATVPAEVACREITWPAASGRPQSTHAIQAIGAANTQHGLM